MLTEPIKCTSCGAVSVNNGTIHCHRCYTVQAERIEDLQDEMQQVSNDLYDLYNKCADTTEPEIYGTILGLSERLERFLKGGGAYERME